VCLRAQKTCSLQQLVSKFLCRSLTNLQASHGVRDGGRWLLLAELQPPISCALCFCGVVGSSLLSADHTFIAQNTKDYEPTAGTSVLDHRSADFCLWRLLYDHRLEVHIAACLTVLVPE